MSYKEELKKLEKENKKLRKFLKEYPCLRCHGSGGRMDTEYPNTKIWSNCSECGGSGKIDRRPK